MKAKLNLTIDEDVLSDIKGYAEQKNTSLSALVEEHFKSLSAAPKRKNILDMVEGLQKPSESLEGDLKDKRYQERAAKYGF